MREVPAATAYDACVRTGDSPGLDRVDRADVGAPDAAVHRAPQVAALEPVEVPHVRVEQRVGRLDRRVERGREVGADRGRRRTRRRPAARPGGRSRGWSSLNQVEWMSPASTTGLATRWSASRPSRRSRCGRVAVPLVEVGHRRRDQRPGWGAGCGSSSPAARRRSTGPARRSGCRPSQRSWSRAGQRAGGVAGAGLDGPEVAGEAARLVAAVLPGVEHVEPQPAGRSRSGGRSAGRGCRAAGWRGSACARSTPGTRPPAAARTAPASGGAAPVSSISSTSAGVVVLGLVVVPGDHPRERRVRRLQRRVGLVLRVPVAVVAQRAELVEPGRLRRRVRRGRGNGCSGRTRRCSRRGARTRSRSSSARREYAGQ